MKRRLFALLAVCAVALSACAGMAISDPAPLMELERDLPAMMVELGRAAAARGLDWQGWSDTCPEERDAIIAKYDSLP